MEEPHLYQQIAESFRLEILEGRLKPGERLPSIRSLCDVWHCTPGTAQRAYNELAQQGLLVSHAGKGTRVTGGAAPVGLQARQTLRRANLVHRSEAFLLESLTTGYALEEIQLAFELAMDRWRTFEVQHDSPSAETIRFSGSHDLAVNAMAASFGRISPDALLRVTYTGSLGGLMALAEGKSDIAGSHLWDAETDTYNRAFVHRLLPGRAVRMVTLAHRRQGLIVAPGNPFRLGQLQDLVNPAVRFINRQDGSGTRVWLDANLANLKIKPEQIRGYGDERSTHSEVARSVAEGAADVGLGLETAAFAFGLDFIFLNRERYDLVLLEEALELAPVSRLVDWLGSAEARHFIGRFKGYENTETGQFQS